MNASSRSTRRQPLPVIAWLFATSAVVIYAVWDTPDALLYQRGDFVAIDLLRLLSCHFVHWSWTHLLLDVAVFVVVGAWCERVNRHAFVAFLLGAAVAIPPVVLAVRTDIDSYAGLSGIDTGAVVLAVCLSLFAGPRRVTGESSRRASWPAWFIATIGIAVVAKVVYELAVGHTLMFDSTADFVPVPLAHLVGVGVGVAVAGAVVVKRYTLRQDRF